MARLNSVYGFFSYKVDKGLRSKPKGLKSNWRSTINDRALLDFCIQIEEIKINRSTSIPYQINFRLDRTTLEHLEEIKSSNRKLLLSPAKIANLRCYVLHHIFVEQQLITNPKFQGLSPLTRSPLTFSSHYFKSDRQPIILMRSAIDLKGKISQQVRQDLYQNPQLLTRVSQVHYWLISELLAQLPIKSNKYSWVVLSCSFLVAIAIVAIGWYLFPDHKLFCSSATFSVFIVLNTFFKKTIAKLIKKWLIYHLVEGSFAKNATKRQIGLKLFSSL